MAEPNWKNRTLFEGDNLNFLRAMDSETVDLIATDPPFKKGRDFHATPDSLADGASFQDRWIWEDEVHDDWVDQLQDDHPAVWAVIDWSRLSYGDDMGAFLCFMAVRLLEMKRLLKPTGSIYLHCDPTASHYLKTLMDAIFGRHQFRNEIIRRRNESEAKGSQHKPKTWGTNTDSLLFYTKGKKATFDPRIIRDLTEEEIEKKFPHIDDFGERYKTKPSAHRQPSMGDRPNLYYEFREYGRRIERVGVWRRIAWKRNTKRATSSWPATSWNGEPTPATTTAFHRAIYGPNRTSFWVLGPKRGTATRHRSQLRSMSGSSLRPATLGTWYWTRSAGARRHLLSRKSMVANGPGSTFGRTREKQSSIDL